MGRNLSREWGALLPWVGAFFIWFVLIQPMRVDEAARLSEQSRIRRERLKVTRAEREADALRARIRAALGEACRASADPAVLRQRMVAATKGLPIAPFSLSVTGGPAGGASIEAEGTRTAVLSLTSRLGDPSRGGFLRTAFVRDLGSRFAVGLTTGVFDSFPPGLWAEARECALEAITPAEAPMPDPSPSPRPISSLSSGRSTPAPGALSSPPDAALEQAPSPPFTLVGFLTSNGRPRVALRVGDEVRVVSVGERVAGWSCASIDQDDGAVFVSASGVRLTLKPTR